MEPLTASAATVATGDRRFCSRCGSALVDGMCPTHDEPAKADGRQSTVWGLIGKLPLVALAVGLVVLGIAVHKQATANQRHGRALAADKRAAAAQTAALNGLSRRISELEARLATQPDPSAVSKRVQPSVFTVETEDGLGSAFAFKSAGSRTDLVTNFHVVASTWETGGRSVSIRQTDQTFPGTIDQVDIAHDLALVSVGVQLPTLVRAPALPQAGDPVLAIGSPLGLGGTVTNGIVSAIRKEDGFQYIQFSAPSSPGNSGGPLVDASGRVLGVIEFKAVTTGAEGLSFAIPVEQVCTSIISC